VAAGVKRVYRAQSRIDAYLVFHQLQHAGIRAHVFNVNVSSIVGEVPPDVAAPEVWVEDERDEARARRVIDSLAAQPAASGSTRCAKCGEENPGNFELCWNCGAGL
jgi:hypothetical protein